jgi:AraC-like DNA-binding protein
MNFQFAQPSEKLRPFIRQYWALETEMKSGEHYFQRIIPSGLPEMILYFDHKPEAVSGNRYFEDHFLLSAPQSDFYDIRISQNLNLFSVIFQPQGLHRFFKIPVNELFNIAVPLQYLDKGLSAELRARISGRESFFKKIEIVEDCLVKLLKHHQKDYDFERISGIVGLIRKTRGNVRVEQLASFACLGKKQFERTFSSHIGMTPKNYLKTIRMQAAIYSKSKREPVSLTELAFESGYYDQSHFIHDFKTMTGYTPRQFFSECESTRSDFFEH